MLIMAGWVVTHRDRHDDDESLRRSLTDYASNSADAWKKFISLVGGDRRTWNSRGYVARRVHIRASFEGDSK
jgi:hypothetical protein